MSFETYLQTDFIPILALLAILLNSNSKFASIPNAKRFQRLTFFIIGSLLADAITWYMFSRTDLFPLTIMWIANIAYFILATGTSYFWYVYVYYQINGENLTLHQKRNLTLCKIPFLTICVMVILSPWTHALFYIDSVTHAYIRGGGHLLYSLCIMSYIISACVISFVAKRHALFRTEKTDYNFLLCAGIIPLVGFAFQIINPDLLYIWPSSSVGVCLLYINFQEQRISIDALTSLNNRKNLERFLQVKVNKDNCDWYFIMLDVDDFKFINDKFGHMEGDRALQLIAQGLKKVLGNSSSFICRYGGDEFAIIVDGTKDYEIDTLIQSFRDTVWDLSQVYETPFHIHLSGGYAKFVDLQTTPPLRLVAMADEKMYNDKNMRKHKHMKI